VSVLLAFNIALQTIAAFVIFVVGYAALFGTLSVCFAITMGLYEGAKKIWAYPTRWASVRRETLCASGLKAKMASMAVEHRRAVHGN